MKTAYTNYQYNGLTLNEEGDLIGYTLFKSGYIKDDLTEIDPVNIDTSLNKGGLVDLARIIGERNEEFYIVEVFYSKNGNYLGDNEEFFYT